MDCIDLLQLKTVILGDPAQVVPVASVGYLKCVKIGSDFHVDVVPEYLYCFGLFFVPCVTESLEE